MYKGKNKQWSVSIPKKDWDKPHLIQNALEVIATEIEESVNIGKLNFYTGDHEGEEHFFIEYDSDRTV
jgi:RecB family endonuclease NucS